MPCHRSVKRIYITTYIDKKAVLHSTLSALHNKDVYPTSFIV